LIESLATKRPAYVKALREMAEAGIMSPDTAMDAPADAPAGEADHETALKQGFRAAVMAIMDDDGLDTAAKLKKMRDVLRAEEKLIGGDKEEPARKEGGEDMAAAEESKKLKLEVAGLRLLLEAGLKPTKVLGRALSACTTEAEMKELIEEHKAAPGGSQKPRSAAPPARVGADGKPIQEQRTAPDAGQAPSDTAALGRWLQTPD